MEGIDDLVCLSEGDFESHLEHVEETFIRLLNANLEVEKQITFYSQKLNSAQRRYTPMERELLSIVKTLKEFKTILLGYKIEIYTDHSILVHETTLLSFNCIMRWRLLIEEYGPDTKYIPGPDNVVVDALSWLLMVDDNVDVRKA